MEYLRTPDNRFQNLSNYPFSPNYLEVSDTEGGQLRIHCVDEGPVDAAPVILFHGEPTWSYLYRKMIPIIAAAGYRVLAPDLVGFGKSDKPTKKSDYTFSRHVEWMRDWLFQLNLRNITFFGQDWGSLIGLTICALEKDRIDRIIIGNGGLPDPRHPERMEQARSSASLDPNAFSRWQDWIEKQDFLDIRKFLDREIPGLTFEGVPELNLSKEEKAAYEAPFPDGTFQAGALVFPLLFPRGPEDIDTINLFIKAWEIYDHWEKPFLTAYGKADPVTFWYAKIL